jgi:hypothetical protein
VGRRCDEPQTHDRKGKRDNLNEPPARRRPTSLSTSGARKYSSSPRISWLSRCSGLRRPSSDLPRPPKRHSRSSATCPPGRPRTDGRGDSRHRRSGRPQNRRADRPDVAPPADQRRAAVRGQPVGRGSEVHLRRARRPEGSSPWRLPAPGQVARPLERVQKPVAAADVPAKGRLRYPGDRIRQLDRSPGLARRPREQARLRRTPTDGRAQVVKTNTTRRFPLPPRRAWRRRPPDRNRARTRPLRRSSCPAAAVRPHSRRAETRDRTSVGAHVQTAPGSAPARAQTRTAPLPRSARSRATVPAPPADPSRASQSKGARELRRSRSSMRMSPFVGSATETSAVPRSSR